MAAPEPQWEVVTGFQNAMRELEALTINIYMTDASKLEKLRRPLERLFVKFFDISRETKCGEPMPCSQPRRCCKDGFCKLVCGIGPNFDIDRLQGRRGRRPRVRPPVR